MLARLGAISAEMAERFPHPAPTKDLRERRRRGAPPLAHAEWRHRFKRVGRIDRCEACGQEATTYTVLAVAARACLAPKQPRRQGESASLAGSIAAFLPGVHPSQALRRRGPVFFCVQ